MTGGVPDQCQSHRHTDADAMFWALLIFCFLLQIVFIVNLPRLLFRSQRPSAKKWLKISGAAVVVCVSGAGFIAMRESDQKAVALGFEDGSDLEKAKAAGIDDPAAWRARKVELEAAAGRQRKEEERKAAAAREIAAAKEKAAAQKRAEEEKLAAWKEQNCHKELDCIGPKKSVLANSYCQAPVESLAKYQAEWTDGWVEKKFPYYRWGNRDGVVIYYGGAVKFQNGFGAWQNMVYECYFDIWRDQPVDVRAEAGRLR